LPEAFTIENQRVGNRQMSAFAAAQKLGVAVITSAALLQAKLAAGLPAFVRETLDCESDPEAAIQFARSGPGVSTALVGMSRKEHVDANLKVARKSPAQIGTWESLFQKAATGSKQ